MHERVETQYRGGGAHPPPPLSDIVIDLTGDVPNVVVEPASDRTSTQPPAIPAAPQRPRTPDERVARAIDVAVALAALLVLLPMALAVAVAVRTTSRGPVFYRQHRCGRDGRSFQILKFRTMVRDADAPDAVTRHGLADTDALATVDAPAFKAADDPRVTRVGRVLRRTSVDELPQLVNVLVGEMALVGPRPLVWGEASTLPDDHFRVRHTVRPGITGRWQVERTEDMSFDERMRLDVEYARTRSVATDLLLLLRTPRSVLRGNGAF